MVNMAMCDRVPSELLVIKHLKEEEHLMEGWESFNMAEGMEDNCVAEVWEKGILTFDGW